MQKPKKINWNLIVRIGGSLLSVLILAVIFSDQVWAKVWQQLKSLEAWRVAACLALIFISRLATWGRWHTLLSISEPKVTWRDSLRLTFTGLFAANVLPTTIGGDLARLAGAVRLGIDGHLAAASLVADRLIGMTGMSLALPFSLPALSKLQAGGALQSTAMFAGLGQKIRQSLEKVWGNLRYWLKHPRLLLQALFFTLVHQACLYLILMVLIEGFGERMPFLVIAGLWSLVYFITLVPISINGLGLQELSISNIFSLLGGLSPSTGLSIALLMRVIQIIGSLPGALFLGSVMGGTKEMRQADGPDQA